MCFVVLWLIVSVENKTKQKRPLPYIADSGFRYALFGLSVYLLYFLATDQEKMQLREAISHFGIVVLVSLIVGLIISSVRWWFMKRGAAKNGPAI